ncbi:MAG: 50S ribosomal protein L13 [Planctomycetota bacterium]|nr:50S ribosomal protein L13 [Planctomycetota bacterium]
MHRRDTVLVKQGDVKKVWRVVNAEGVPLGRLASDVALVLMGKHRPEYTPHIACGDAVIVLNGTKVGLTGRKADQRFKQRYSGYPGGLKMESYGSVRQRRPEKLIQDAVRRMLPKNRMSRVMLKNLYVFEGADHPHADKNPVQMVV